MTEIFKKLYSKILKKKIIIVLENVKKIYTLRYVNKTMPILCICLHILSMHHWQNPPHYHVV